MDLKLEKIHWQKAEQDNINMILQCRMQIEMAEQILKMCRNKIKSFPITKEEKEVQKLQDKILKEQKATKKVAA